MAGIWEKEIFRKGVLTVNLNDINCNLFQENKTHLWISASFSTCNSRTTVNENWIVHENIAKVTINVDVKNIRRTVIYNYHMACYYDRIHKVMTSNGFFAEDKELNKYGNNTKGFEAEMKLYTSESYLKEVEADPYIVSSFQPIFVGIRVKPEASLKFIVRQCYAAASADGDNAQYTFFDAMCPTDDTFEELGSGDEFYNFKIEAFRFIQVRQTIKLHCTLVRCLTDSNEPDCVHQCSIKRRRRTVFEASLGPLEKMDVKSSDIVFRKQKSCKELKCPKNARCIDLYPAVCRCSNGYVGNKKSGLCQKDNIITVGNIHIEEQYLDSYDEKTSTDYQRLMLDLEQEFLVWVPFDDVIEGIKVVDVRRGRLIVKVAVIYGKSISAEKAFESFSWTIMNYSKSFEPDDNKIHIRDDTIPTMEEKIKPFTMDNELIIGIAAAISVLILAVIGLIFLKRYLKKNRDEKVPKIPAPAFDNNGLEVNAKEM